MDNKEVTIRQADFNLLKRGIEFELSIYEGSFS